MSLPTPRVNIFELVEPPSGVVPVFPNFVIDRREHLAATMLPAYPSFTNQAFEAIPGGTKRAAFWVSYTRGAAGGFPVFHFEAGNGTDAGRDVLDDPVIVITEPNGRFENPLSEPFGPLPQTGAPLTYVRVYELPPNTTSVRLLASEGSGLAAGTLALGFTADG